MSVNIKRAVRASATVLVVSGWGFFLAGCAGDAFNIIAQRPLTNEPIIASGLLLVFVGYIFDRVFR